MNQHTTGLYPKFFVKRRDDRDNAQYGDRRGADYFVLDLTYDKFAKKALTAYADDCRLEYPDLAEELYTKLGVETPKWDELRNKRVLVKYNNNITEAVVGVLSTNKQYISILTGIDFSNPQTLSTSWHQIRSIELLDVLTKVN